jgi:hypothetical protein
MPAVSVAGLTPGILGPSSPTNVEKNQNYLLLQNEEVLYG